MVSPMTSTTTPGLRFAEMGTVVGFVFAVAPQHPLARHPQPLSDEVLQALRQIGILETTLTLDGTALPLRVTVLP